MQAALYLTYKLLNQDSFRLPSLLLHFNLSVYFSPLSFHSLLTDLIYHLQILSPIIASAIPSMLNFLYLNILSSFSPFDKRSLVNLEFWIPSLLLSFLRSNTPSSSANLSLIPLIFIVTYLFVPFDSISGPSLPPGPAPTPFPSSSPSPFPPSPPPPSGHGPFPHLPNSLLLSC